MAITLIDGVPGSGKTLYAVHHLVKNHYSKVGGIYEKKDDHILISNIDDLSLLHIDLDSEVDKAGGVKNYFSKDFQEKLFKEKGAIIYVIDEAQFKFDRKFYDKLVFNWFQYHRHFGQTVYLISQNCKNLPAEIQYCTEFIVRALPRSRSLLNKFFHYSLISGRDVIGSEKIAANKELFSLYCSQKADTVETTKRPFFKVLILNLSFAVLCLVGGTWFFSSNLNSKTPGPGEAVASSSPAAPSVQNFTSSAGSSKPVFTPKQNLSPEADIIPHRWQKVSSFTVGNDVQILYEGVHTLRSFPYKIQLRGSDYYAFIPQDIEES